MDSPSYHQTIALPDGRTLGFAEYGPRTGYPVLFLHGWPSSRLEASGIASLASRRRMRLISPDRPGFGLSSFAPRSIADYPADVRALAAHLGLARFALLGGSGGGPFALACARELPRGMLAGVGLLSSAGPWVAEEARKGGRDVERREALTREVLWSQWFAYLAATYCPWGLRVVSDGLVGVARWLVGTGPVIRWIDRLLDGLKKAKEEKAQKADADVDNAPVGRTSNDLIAIEEETRSTAEARERLLRIIFEPFAQGAGAMVHEARLLTQPWGFRFGDVDYDEIQIWHGVRDKNAPIRQIRYMAARLPHCVLHELDNKNHFALIENLGEIIDALVPEEDRAKFAVE